MGSRIPFSVEDDPTPLVMAIAADLAALFEDPSFAQQTEGLEGTASVRARTTSETVMLRLRAEGLSLAHGSDDAADLKAIMEGPGADGPEIEGEDEHPELAGWLRRVLDPPIPDWRDAAQRFWSVLGPMPGAPSALLVVNLDRDEKERYGAAEGRAYEIHGPTVELLSVLSGRTPLLDAAFEGRVYLRGSFPEISVLSGAADAVRLGLARA